MTSPARRTRSRAVVPATPRVIRMAATRSRACGFERGDVAGEAAHPRVGVLAVHREDHVAHPRAAPPGQRVVHEVGDDRLPLDHAHVHRRDRGAERGLERGRGDPHVGVVQVRRHLGQGQAVLDRVARGLEPRNGLGQDPVPPLAHELAIREEVLAHGPDPERRQEAVGERGIGCRPAVSTAGAPGHGPLGAAEPRGSRARGRRPRSPRRARRPLAAPAAGDGGRRCRRGRPAVPRPPAAR